MYGILRNVEAKARCGKGRITMSRREHQLAIGRTPLKVSGALAVTALVAALLITIGCAPLLRPMALPRGATPAGSPEPCDLPDVDDQVLEAAWAHVHERYPAQPWPDTVYLPRDWTVVVASKRYLSHVVLCSHATGFLWEGEIAWHVECRCCRVDVDGVRESFVAISAPAAPTAARSPGDVRSP
jgi:hypothetical protein